MLRNYWAVMKNRKLGPKSSQNNHSVRITFVLSRNLVTSTFTVWSVPNSSVIIGTPDSDESFRALPICPWHSQLSLLLRSQGGGGACILRSVRVGLSLLEQSRAVLPTHVLPVLIWLWQYYLSDRRTRCWMTGGVLLSDISSCDDVQILSWSLVVRFLCRTRRGILYCLHCRGSNGPPQALSTA